MENFFNLIQKIKSKEDFIEFLELLQKDLRVNPETWENITLEDYLSGMQSWTEDMEGFYRNFNMKVPENVDWKVFAHILIAAKMYE